MLALEGIGEGVRKGLLLKAQEFLLAPAPPQRGPNLGVGTSRDSCSSSKSGIRRRGREGASNPSYNEGKPEVFN